MQKLLMCLGQIHATALLSSQQSLFPTITIITQKKNTCVSRFDVALIQQFHFFSSTNKYNSSTWKNSNEEQY